MIKDIFEIIYTFKPSSVTYTQVFFTDQDDIYKININSSVFSKLNSECNGDKLQAYLRKRYDYHNDLVSQIDEIELNGMVDLFRNNGEEEKAYRIESIFRKRKIDDLIG